MSSHKPLQLRAGIESPLPVMCTVQTNKQQKTAWADERPGLFASLHTCESTTLFAKELAAYLNTSDDSASGFISKLGN